MKISKDVIKQKAIELDFDLCGIASIDRFSQYYINLMEILPSCKSIIVVAKRFLFSTLKSESTIPYTILRNQLSVDIDINTIKLSTFLEGRGFDALPTGAIEPCNYNRTLDKSMGLISLKHAAQQAGLGVIGKNTLLLTPEYGNMVWLGAILSSAPLQEDPLQTYNPCRDTCRLCIDRCPVQALDGSLFMDQGKCWDYAFGEPEEGGEWRIKCFQCRKVCPFARGYSLPC